MIIQVRKQLRDMEAKLKDQEEELDEQAGTIQMLEQVQSVHSAPITGQYSDHFLKISSRLTSRQVGTYLYMQHTVRLLYGVLLVFT